MGEDCGSCFPPWQFNWQSHNLNRFGAPFFLGQQRLVPPSYLKAGTNMVLADGTLPVLPFPELAHSRVGQKRFLIFDRPADQTKLIFGSGFECPAQCFTTLNPQEAGLNTLTRKVSGIKEYPDVCTRTNFTHEISQNAGTDLQSEMHEDTEELNALLHSDDNSNYTLDDEVTSTGRSPSLLTTAHVEPVWVEANVEKVGSSDGLTRKRKFHDINNGDIRSFIDTAISLKSIRVLKFEDDAESKCDIGTSTKSAEMGSESDKRTRKGKLHEIINVLQNIIPGGKGKDATVVLVLDEAILYLKSLKVEAKALGLE